MKFDQARNLNLSSKEAESVLSKLFQFEVSEFQQILPKVLKNGKIVYEDLMTTAIEYQMCVKTPQKIHSLDRTQFALKVKEGMCFLRAQPVDLFLE